MMIRSFVFAGALSLLAAAGAVAQDSFDSQPSAQPQQQPQQSAPQQQIPQQQQPQPQQQQGWGQPQQQAPTQPSGGPLDQLAQMERQDYGVAPTSQLHAGAMHGPTPASIPGGQVITTRGVLELVQGGQVRALILDVLGGNEMIPGAQFAVPAAQPGSFNDQTQAQFGQFLQQATGGNKEHPIVLYCLSTQCWMSYNAALRAINMGYTNVLWYRGGIEAWKQAGQQVAPTGGGYQ